MNIGQIHGGGGIDRSPNRSQSTKVGARHHERSLAHDSATISDSSRETLREFEGISARLHDDAGDRQNLIAEVRGRLESGYLHQESVLRDVARSILSGD